MKYSVDFAANFIDMGKYSVGLGKYSVDLAALLIDLGNRVVDSARGWVNLCRRTRCVCPIRSNTYMYEWQACMYVFTARRSSWRADADHLCIRVRIAYPRQRGCVYMFTPMTHTRSQNTRP